MEMIGHGESKLIKTKYLNYAQFVQSQMSVDELLILFYNSFCFPKMKMMLIKYNLLENLNVDKLINKAHNCVSDYHLKKL